MKRIALAIAGLAVISTAAFAQSNQVLSRNAVGYVKVSTTRSNMHFMAHNFLDINGGPVTVTNLIGSQVPNGSVVIVWDSGNQAYRFENRVAGQWLPGTNRLVPGRGFWLRVNPAAASNAYQVYMMGEVPDGSTLPTNSQTIVPGLNMLGESYPVSVKFTNTTLATGGRNSDVAIFWNEAAQGYVFENRVAGQWLPGTNVVSPGRGFWYRSTRTSNVVWTSTKPYTWP